MAILICKSWWTAGFLEKLCISHCITVMLWFAPPFLSVIPSLYPPLFIFSISSTYHFGGFQVMVKSRKTSKWSTIFQVSLDSPKITHGFCLTLPSHLGLKNPLDSNGIPIESLKSSRKRWCWKNHPFWWDFKPCPHKIMILSPAFSVNIVKMSIIHENHGDFFMGIPKSSGHGAPALWQKLTPRLRQTPKEAPHLAALRDHGWGQHHQSAAHPSSFFFWIKRPHSVDMMDMILWESTEIRLEENGWKYDDLLGCDIYIYVYVYIYMYIYVYTLVGRIQWCVCPTTWFWFSENAGKPPKFYGLKINVRERILFEVEFKRWDKIVDLRSMI